MNATAYWLCLSCLVITAMKICHSIGVGEPNGLSSMVKSLVTSGISFIQVKEILSRVYEENIGDICELPYPREKFLEELFLDSFFKHEDAIVNKLSRTTADTWISADHTFKSVVNIGYTRPSDGKWIKQFGALFCVLNERGQVLKWQFTKDTKSISVASLFQELSLRFKSQEKKIEIVFVDNCCQVRKQFQDLLGDSELKVKLDLFHAVKRFVDTIPKRGSIHRRQIVRDYRLVFRSDGDHGKARTKKTPCPIIMLRNLDRFVKKWKRKKNARGKCILNGNSLKAIKNIKKHISMGCLSGIPLGAGTNRNERLHRKLKKLTAKSKMGSKLAYAVFSIIFNDINNKLQFKNESLHKSGEHLERFGFLNDTLHNLMDDNEHCEDSFVDIVAPAVERTMFMHELLSLLKQKGFGAVEELETLSFMNSFKPSKNVSHSESDLLHQRTSEFGFEIDTVLGDGDCFFRALGRQLLRLLSAEIPTSVRIHLQSLGITANISNESEIVATLRKLVVQEWIMHPARYQMACDDAKNFALEANAFLQQGHYASGLGDAMPLAASNVLGIPLILITSVYDWPVVAITPETLVNSVPIYLSLEEEHYNCLLESTNKTTELKCNKKAGNLKDKDQKVLKPVSCRCGVNSIDNNRLFCSAEDDSRSTRKRKYSSRCI